MVQFVEHFQEVPAAAGDAVPDHDDVEPTAAGVRQELIQPGTLCLGAMGGAHRPVGTMARVLVLMDAGGADGMSGGELSQKV